MASFDFVSAVVLKGSSLMTLKNDPVFLHDYMNWLQSSSHMLPVTRRCGDALVQLVVGGELLTPAAQQTACRLEEEGKECCEEVMVTEEAGVRGGVILC